MKEIRWNLLKSTRLKRTRGVSFEELIRNGKIVNIIEHKKRINQKIMISQYRRYIWVVPFIEEKDYYFLKTLYPSRKLTKIYKKGEV